LKKFILEIASGASMHEYHKHLEFEEPPEEFRLNRKETDAML
jgi:hypothetical protein